ncbi:MAG: 30S ribosomal protein S3ae [Candidatus Aenigmarchaeota archaeon]|nr:30S ribosomal protein S3ae [Candidatus Aenigmarchaeota archaeon]
MAKSTRDKGAKKDTWAKKKWMAVKAPAIFGDRVIAETPIIKDAHAEGRVLEIPMSEITGNFKHFRSKIKVRITGVSENGANTEYVGHEVVRDQILRSVRRWSSRIDSIDDAKTKDNKKLRIKTLVLTRRRVNTSVKDEIRKLTSSIVHDIAKATTKDQIIFDINENKIQKQISIAASKIYPIKFVEIRKTELL